MHLSPKGKVPNVWKEANVTAIHNKNDPSEVANYRLISYLSTVDNVLEKNMFNFLRDHDVLTSLHSGVIPGDFTVNQLVDIYNTLCKALNEGEKST